MSISINKKRKDGAATLTFGQLMELVQDGLRMNVSHDTPIFVETPLDFKMPPFNITTLTIEVD